MWDQTHRHDSVTCDQAVDMTDSCETRLRDMTPRLVDMTQYNA